jgi:hypothetical protein
MLYVTGVIWSVLATVSAHLNLYLDQQEVRRLLGNCFLLLHDSVSQVSVTTLFVIVVP